MSLMSGQNFIVLFKLVPDLTSSFYAIVALFPVPVSASYPCGVLLVLVPLLPVLLLTPHPGGAILVPDPISSTILAVEGREDFVA